MEFISQLLEHPSLFAYFTGANNYSWLQFRNGERRLLAKPLSYFEEQLPSFIRVHKTALINPVSVAELLPPSRPKMAGSVRMQDGIELPVSRRRWNQVVSLLSTSSGVHKPRPVIPESPSSPVHSSGRPAVIVQTVMTVDNLLLTRQCIDSFGFPYRLDHTELGAGLAKDLLNNPEPEWPVLVILDARTNRYDRLIALRALKNHEQLQAIPVVWLASPGDDIMQVYEEEANSVVPVSNEPGAFMQVIEQLCRYWLTMVRLPPRAMKEAA